MEYASKSLSENSITTPIEPLASYTNIGFSRWAMSTPTAEISRSVNVKSEKFHFFRITSHNTGSVGNFPGLPQLNN